MSQLKMIPLLGLCVASGCGVYGLKRLNEHQVSLKKQEFSRDAIAAQAWDELPIRAILKVADPDLRTYFLHEQLYLQAIRDFQEAKPEQRQRALTQLRRSPLFPETSRAFYDLAWYAGSRDVEESIPCGELTRVFPQHAQVLKERFQCDSEHKNTKVDEILLVFHSSL